MLKWPSLMSVDLSWRGHAVLWYLFYFSAQVRKQCCLVGVRRGTAGAPLLPGPPALPPVHQTLHTCMQVTVGPFLNAWFSSQGLSSHQIGLISAFKTWVSLPASFLWGALADYFSAHRAVMLGTLVASSGVQLFLLGAHTFPGIMVLVLLSQVVRLDFKAQTVCSQMGNSVLLFVGAIIVALCCGPDTHLPPCALSPTGALKPCLHHGGCLRNLILL